jgi:hypothetical protein
MNTSQHLPYIALDTVIYDYINGAKKSQNDYFRLWHIAYRGLENLGLDFFYAIKSVKLPINANLTVTLPGDYMNWTKVGLLNSAGEVIPLYYNDKLTTFADVWPNRLEVTQDNLNLTVNDFGPNTWCNYWNGYGYGNIYGVPSGSPFLGSFKIDTVNGVILLNERYDYDYVMLEYMCSPKQGEEYYIPVQFREALIMWLAWQDIIHIPVKTHVENNSVASRRHDFFNERRNSIARWKPSRIYDKYQTHQETSREAIKT